jgi:phosphoglycolate phosphatase
MKRKKPGSGRGRGSCRAVLLDLDGTLIDSSADIAASLNHALSRSGLAPYSVADVQAMIGDGAAQLMAKAFAVRGVEPPTTALGDFKAHYEDHCLDLTRPYEGMPQLLAELARTGTPSSAAVAVVTNKPTSFAEKIVAALGLSPWVRAVVGPELVRAKKPAPEHVLDTLVRLGVEPSEALVVGDGTTDILSGRAAGAATVAVLWGYRSREELEAAEPDFFASTPAELAALLDVEITSR